jgi:HEAT repeat protein
MEVRVAVAAAAPEMPPEESDDLLADLLDDDHAAVRKFAINAVSERNSEAVRAKVGALAATEADSRMRALADEKARSVS